MTQPFIDVHTFDGKLKGIYKPIQKFNIETKTQLFNDLVLLLENPMAKHTVTTIINDLHSSLNYQQENDIDASDILADLIQYYKIHTDTDIIKCLNEQLVDIITLGVCPSGRVTRLLQIWNAFNIEKT